jgi:uncharacterized membrane protein YozB (DUF420 family)
MSRIVRVCCWILLALAATAIGLVSLRYVTGNPAAAPRELRSNMIERLPWFVAHTVAGAVALLVVPWQLVPALRRRSRRLHRWLGRIYVAAVGVSGICALPVALGSFAGPIAASGFGTLAVCWLGTTAVGWRLILRGNVEGHRRWMLRSAALTCAALTLRLYLPLPAALGFTYVEGYRFIAWACWVPNLLLVEYILRQRQVQLVATG